MSIIHVPEFENLDGLTREEVLALEVSESDMETAHDDMLSEVFGEVEICGYKYDAARALREVDPIAYRCGYADYVSAYYAEVDPDDFPEVIEDDDATCEICHQSLTEDERGTLIDPTGGDVCMNNDGLDGPHLSA